MSESAVAVAAVGRGDAGPVRCGGQVAARLDVPGSDLGPRGDVNAGAAPHALGETPRPTSDEVQTVVALLSTLTGGDDSHPSERYRWPAQCEAAEPPAEALPTR